MPKLSIIILSFNTQQLTLQCVESLRKNYELELKNDIFEILIADNASSDTSVAVLQEYKKKYPELSLKIIQNKENYGFTKGNNKASEYAKGEYLLFLNSDTEVKDNSIVKILSFMDATQSAGIVGAKLTDRNNNPQNSAGKFYNLLSVFILLLGSERFGFLRFSPKEIQVVDWVSGGSLLIRKELFKRLEGFDEKFFMYMEDMELCYRVKKVKLLTYFYPDISIIHQDQGSSNRTFAVVQIYKGLLYFYKKHKPFWQYRVVQFLLLSKAGILVFVGKIVDNKYLITTYEEAFTISR